MAESSIKDTQQSKTQWQYSGDMVKVRKDRLEEEEKDLPNTRLYRNVFEQIEAVRIGDANEEVNRDTQERVRQKTEEARNHDVFGGNYGIRFEDMLVFSQRGVDPGQFLPNDAMSDACLSTNDILARLTDLNISPRARQQLVCEVELIKFTGEERETILQWLWQYIRDYRDSNDRDELVAVGAAIRKYIAMMPMEQMGKLAELLEPGHRAPLPMDLEIEVAKMVYRNFEVYPPQQPDPHPELAARLWEMAQDYTKPRFLLRPKHSTVASLAIEALVAMRSAYAEEAWRTALHCPYRWFSEIVRDRLEELRKRWACRDNGAVAWLDDLVAMAADT